MACGPVSGSGLKWTNEDGFGGGVDSAAADEDGAIVDEITVGDVAGDFENDATVGGGLLSVGLLILLFFTFFGSLVATALILVTFGAAAGFLVASLAILASLDFLLQSKHVRRGDIVPFLMFSRKWVSNFSEHVSISVLHSRHRVVGVPIVDGDDDEIAEIE